MSKTKLMNSSLSIILVGFITYNFFVSIQSSPALIIPSYAADAPTDCEHSSTAFRCVVYVRNYDGDTVTFNIKNIHPLFGEKINVRVYGIDTPEIRTQDKCEKEKGRIAKKLVKNLLSNAKRIDLENVRRDKYFRILADIKYDQKSLSEVLLKNKLANVYFGDTKKKTNWCDPERDIAKDKNTNGQIK